MAVNLNGLSLEGGTTFTATNGSHRLFHQDGNGITKLPTDTAGATMIPLFHVGRGNAGVWNSMGTGVQAFGYTGGNGYVNIGSCYNTTNYRFTAPWTGFYLFQVSMYCYYPDGGYGYYFHPFFTVNGSSSARRPGGSPYRIRGYGCYGSYAVDADNCELIYLTAGDYVEQYNAVGGGMQVYDSYAAWSGVYIGN
jgi:hypothetical protein